MLIRFYKYNAVGMPEPLQHFFTNNQSSQVINLCQVTFFSFENLRIITIYNTSDYTQPDIGLLRT